MNSSTFACFGEGSRENIFRLEPTIHLYGILKIRQMKEDSEKIKELPGILRGLPENEFFPFSLLGTGLPRGALIELSGGSGGGKTEAILRFLSENPSLRAGWVESRFSLFPGALPQWGVSLERLLFVEAAGKRALWAAHQLLSSQLFSVVVLSLEESPSEDRSELALRRLQLAAGRARACVLLLADKPHGGAAWPIAVRLRVRRAREKGGEGLRVEILKNRGQSVPAQGPKDPMSKGEAG
jgi:hypothetical protein